MNTPNDLQGRVELWNKIDFFFLIINEEDKIEICRDIQKSIENGQQEVNSIVNGDEFGFKSIHYACVFGNDVLFRFLVTNGADLKVKDLFDQDLLFFTINFGHQNLKLEMIQFLFENKIGLDKINQGNEHNQTLLHRLCIAEEIVPEIIVLFLKHNANPNAKDDEGLTPLHVLLKYSYNKYFGIEEKKRTFESEQLKKIKYFFKETGLNFNPKICYEFIENIYQSELFQKAPYCEFLLKFAAENELLLLNAGLLIYGFKLPQEIKNSINKNKNVQLLCELENQYKSISLEHGFQRCKQFFYLVEEKTRLNLNEKRQRMLSFFCSMKKIEQKTNKNFPSILYSIIKNIFMNSLTSEQIEHTTQVGSAVYKNPLFK